MRIDIIVVYVPRYRMGHEKHFVPSLTGIHHDCRLADRIGKDASIPVNRFSGWNCPFIQVAIIRRSQPGQRASGDLPVRLHG